MSLEPTATTPTPAKLRKGDKGKEKGEKDKASAESRGGGQNSWLNISMDAALGFRANVFQVFQTKLHKIDNFIKF